MAAAGELPLAASALSTPNFNGCYDPSDMEAFIDFEPVYPSPSLSPSGDGKSLNVPSSSQSFTNGNAPSASPATLSSSSSFGSNPQFSQQLSFSAPSHQYGSYQQQTGLPMGGLANTMAINRSAGMNMGYGEQGFGLGAPNDGMYPYGSRAYPPLSAETPDMDLDLDGTTLQQNGGLPSQGTKAQFVDPNALGGQELSPVAPPGQVGRMYPGFHQQQAAKAKAAQQQKQQQEMLRRQQQQQQQQQQTQQPQQPQMQQTQPLQDGPVRQPSRTQNKATRPSDPIVEERITRLLQQMRQSSVSVKDDSPGSNSLPHILKQKKEEQDMDEDERLLASEEGKKLSSKERRQLRNKVSARAFRSRRKEYIGQLEGEVTVKTNEANDLRLQNRALMEENARLTDLTRMLLSSPPFAHFLNDMSTNQTAGLSQQSSTAPTSTPNPVNDKKTSQASNESQMPNSQTGLPMIPEESFNMTSMDLPDSGWNSGIDVNLNTPSVFAVLDVPEGPAIDSGILSGKSSNFVEPLSSDESKDLPLTIEHPPVDAPQPAKEQPSTPADVDIDESDPAFALFLDQPPTASTTKEPGDTFSIESDKASTHFEVVVEPLTEEEQSTRDQTSLLSFQRFQASIEGSYRRVSLAARRLR